MSESRSPLRCSLHAECKPAGPVSQGCGSAALFDHSRGVAVGGAEKQHRRTSADKAPDAACIRPGGCAVLRPAEYTVLLCGICRRVDDGGAVAQRPWLRGRGKGVCQDVCARVGWQSSNEAAACSRGCAGRAAREEAPRGGENMVAACLGDRRGCFRRARPRLRACCLCLVCGHCSPVGMKARADLFCVLSDAPRMMSIPHRIDHSVVTRRPPPGRSPAPPR